MKNKEPLISIIVNCFNGERYLNECLNSILSQSYKNYEVIFWDNQSTDKSKSIFLNIKDNRFKYFSDNEHVTLYGARNKALKVTTGKYVAFLDVDDMWFPDKLEKQVKVMEKNSEIGGLLKSYKYDNDIYFDHGVIDIKGDGISMNVVSYCDTRVATIGSRGKPEKLIGQAAKKQKQVSTLEQFFAAA